ncbi:MAG: putative toxin-antitoxin system toxin component, PIN family [Methylomonas sp.]
MAIIDTNVVVSGLISGDPQALVCRVLDGMLTASFIYLVSPALLDEYREVLLRPKLKKCHGLSVVEVDRILEDIVANAIWREPDQSLAAPEPGDDHLWALMATHKGCVLVTGDRLLLENPPDFASVISLRSFVELLGWMGK